MEGMLQREVTRYKKQFIEASANKKYILE